MTVRGISHARGQCRRSSQSRPAAPPRRLLGHSEKDPAVAHRGAGVLHDPVVTGAFALGGDATETAALGQRTGPGFSFEEVPNVVERIVETYVARRNGPRETFLQTYRRLGLAPFKAALYPEAQADAA